MVGEIIKYGDYLLVIDDSEIKSGDWVLANFPKLEFWGIVKWVGNSPQGDIKKIIAHSPLPKSYLEGIEILPELDGKDIPKYFDFETKKYIY
jgi:hypothetical protein